MVPEHYKMDGVESIVFIDTVLEILENSVPLTARQAYSVKDALKYAIRAGKKGPWEEDAFKCADYLCRAMYGFFINDGRGEECSEES